MIKNRLLDGRRHYLWVAALAFSLRLIWVIVAVRPPTFLSDPLIYLGYGQSIGSGIGYTSVFSHEPTAYFPPGYPFFVGALTYLETNLPSPSLSMMVGLAQCFIGTATVIIAMSIGRRLLGTKAGLATGLILALAPNLIIHTSLLLSETLFLAVSTLSLWLALETTHKPDPKLYAALTGVTMGASMLIRPQGAFVGVAIAAYWLAKFSGETSSGFRQRWKPHRLKECIQRGAVPIAAFGLGVVLVVAPWTIRNLVVMDSLVFISTNVGDNMCIGSGPKAYGGYRLENDCDVEHQHQDGTRDEVLHNQETMAIARETIADDPLRFIELMPHRIWGTITNDHDGVFAATEFGNTPWLPSAVERTLEILSDAWWFGLSAAFFSAIAAKRLWRERDAIFLFGCTVAAFGAPLLSFAHPRFKIPALVFMTLIAASWFMDDSRARADHNS